MRTVIVTNGNMLTLLGLGEFLLQHHHDVVAVFVTTRLPSQKSNVLGVLSMARKSGLRYAHFKLLTNLWMPRRLSRRDVPARVTPFLRRLGSSAACYETTDINQPEMIERVRAYEPEVLLSYSATTRFSDELIQTARRTAINAHYALLPAYAGLSPYFWYLRNRESECGVTLHSIISRLDAGPVIEQRRFPMAGHRTVFSVLLEQAASVAPTLLNFYAGRTSEAAAVPQDLSKRSYFRHPTRADVRALYADGNRFYDASDLQRCEQTLRDLAARAG